MVGATASLKKKILNLLKEDEEFRYAVVGLLGLDAVLSELRKLREDFNRYVELEEKRWEENSKRWEENAKRWEENNKRWEENSKRWEEAYKRFEAIENELRALREDFNRAYLEFSRKLDALGARWGVIAEEAFREGMRGVVEKILGVAKVGKWMFKDEAGEVYGYPSIVEVDMVVKDGIHALVEVKSSVSKGDVLEFWRVGKLYEKVTGVKPRLVMISPYVDDKAFEVATNLGVEIYTQLS